MELLKNTSLYLSAQTRITRNYLYRLQFLPIFCNSSIKEETLLSLCVGWLSLNMLAIFLCFPGDSYVSSWRVGTGDRASLLLAHNSYTNSTTQSNVDSGRVNPWNNVMIRKRRQQKFVSYVWMFRNDDGAILWLLLSCWRWVGNRKKGVTDVKSDNISDEPSIP